MKLLEWIFGKRNKEKERLKAIKVDNKVISEKLAEKEWIIRVIKGEKEEILEDERRFAEKERLYEKRLEEKKFEEESLEKQKWLDEVSSYELEMEYGEEIIIEEEVSEDKEILVEDSVFEDKRIRLNEERVRIEIEEEKWAIAQEKKEDKKYKFYDEALEFNGYCNFLFNGYCHKYDFGPVDCGPRANEYGCSWRERRLSEYMVESNEEFQTGDIINDKRLTMFGEYYYDRDQFNEENYQDMLDFYEYILKDND